MLPDAPRRRERRAAADEGDGRFTAAPAFVLASLLVLGTAVYTQANLLFWLFGLSVGAALFAAGHGALALRGLSVRRLPPGRCVAGASVSLGYELHNGGRLACLSVRVRELGQAGAWALVGHRARPPSGASRTWRGSCPGCGCRGWGRGRRCGRWRRGSRPRGASTRCSGWRR